MTTNGFVTPALETPRLRLDPFTEEFLTATYVSWLNDPEVVRYSEQRLATHTVESCRAFMDGFTDSRDGFWAIRDKARDLCHIGNINTAIDTTGQAGDIRILIGDKQAWGSGLGADAWTAVMDHLFNDLGMLKVTAGTRNGNTGMVRIMEKAGMSVTHHGPGETPIDGRPMDLVFAERLAPAQA